MASLPRYRLSPPARVDVAARQNAVTYSSVVDVIDITFDFRSDTPPGLDPDTYSPTLRRYHQLLWSKPLPSGAPFELDVTTPRVSAPPLRARRVLVVERCGDSVLLEVVEDGAHHRSDPGSGARRVQSHRLHDRRDDGLSGQSGRSQDDDQRCAWIPTEDRGPVRSDGGVHPPALP